MALFQLNSKPSNWELRWFAGVWFPALCGMAGWLVLKKLHAPIASAGIWGAGGVLSLIGLLSPPVMRPIYLLIMRLTFPIGWVLSHAVLAIAYFVFITPIGVVMRWFHDPMQRKFVRVAPSYWLPREQPEKSRYFRQT